MIIKTQTSCEVTEGRGSTDTEHGLDLDQAFLQACADEGADSCVRDTAFHT